MSFTFDDFLTADPRGIVPPLVAPALTVNASGVRIVDGVPVASIVLIRRESSATHIRTKLLAAPARSLTMLRKGRSAMVDNEPWCNCSYGGRRQC